MARNLHGNHSLSRSRSRSNTLIVTLALFALSIIVILFSLTSSVRPSSDLYHSSSPWQESPSTLPETSFFVSLKHFLIHNAPKVSVPVGDDTVHAERDDDTSKFDEAVSEREKLWMDEDPTYPLSFPVKVYVYEMPKKFTYELLWLFHNSYNEPANFTSNRNPVHRLIKQHSVDNWLGRI